MSTHYEVVYQAYKANTWARTDFRFAGITEAAQFCATTGNRLFIVAVENDCQRSLDEDEQKELHRWKIHKCGRSAHGWHQLNSSGTKCSVTCTVCIQGHWQKEHDDRGIPYHHTLPRFPADSVKRDCPACQEHIRWQNERLTQTETDGIGT